jgi:hypothetical protein
MLDILRMLFTASVVVFTTNSFAGEPIAESRLGLYKDTLSVCSNHSNYKGGCFNDILKIKNSSSRNSILFHCVGESKTADSLSRCIKLKHNPMVYLKYGDFYEVSSVMRSDFLKGVISECNSRDSQNSQMQCIYDRYILLSRATDPDNWIENSCVSKSFESPSAVLVCASELSKKAGSKNNMASEYQFLMPALEKLSLKIRENSKNIFNAVHKSCYSRYGIENTVKCVDSKVSRVFEKLSGITEVQVKCLSLGRISEVESCLSKKP